MLSSLLFVIGCAEQNAEKAVEEIRARYFAQIELQERRTQKHEVIFTDQEKLDKQLKALSKIKKDMGDIAAKYPKTKVISRWLSNSDLSEYSFNKRKIDWTIDILNHEKNLFHIRDKIVDLSGTNPEQGVFNFDFAEMVTSSCSASGKVNEPAGAGYYSFHPPLANEALKPFFLKFDDLTDSLIFNHELQQKALKELPRDELSTIGFEYLSPFEEDVSPADVYKWMLNRFLRGYAIPEGLVLSKSGQVKDKFSQQLNTILASCSSGEIEFIERVGTWLPKDSKLLLEAVGNKKDQVPVWISLYGDTPHYEEEYLFDPLVKNLKEKYGDPLFSSWEYVPHTIKANFWITDDGRLIVVQFKTLVGSDLLPDDTQTALGYINLPSFIKNYQSWLDTYNNELSDFIEMRLDNIKDLQENRDEGLQSKL